LDRQYELGRQLRQLDAIERERNMSRADEDQRAAAERRGEEIDKQRALDRERVKDAIANRRREVDAAKGAAAEETEIARKKVQAILEAGRAMVDAMKAKDRDAAEGLWSPEQTAQKKFDIVERAVEYAKKQTDEAAKAAALAQKEAEERERSTRATQAQTNAIRQQVDITKRFSTLPGSGGMFGFGAGQVGGVWSGDPVQRRRGRRGAPGGAAPQGGGVGQGMPDLSPAVAGTTAAIKALPAQYQRLANALGTMQQAAQETLERVGTATTRAVSKVAEQVAALRTRVKNVEDRLASAAGLGSGG
jgi:hypothetical protein